METQKHKKALRGLFTKTEPSEPKANPILQKKQKKTFTQSKPTSQPKKSNVKTQPIEYIQPVSSPQELHHIDVIKKENLNDTFTKIQYNFDLRRTERNTWYENDYISFLNRIDHAQTEAFFLKGKLIGEIKEKFYVNNKTGWKNFCDNFLNMNYTTANQYIRVAQEFDVTNNKRKDFGFEHFKALLPLPSEARSKIMEDIPDSISVKSLRDLVTKTLDHSHTNEIGSSSKMQSNAITENLQKIKVQLDSLNVSELTQTERWKLFGAFRSLSEEMSHYANVLSKSSEIIYKSKNTLESFSEDEVQRSSQYQNIRSTRLEGAIATNSASQKEETHVK